MSVQTYDNYGRAYWNKNRYRIRERTRAYRKKYNREYYLRKKLEREIAEKNKISGVNLEDIKIVEKKTEVQ